MAEPLVDLTDVLNAADMTPCAILDKVNKIQSLAKGLDSGESFKFTAEALRDLQSGMYSLQNLIKDFASVVSETTIIVDGDGVTLNGTPVTY